MEFYSEIYKRNLKCNDDYIFKNSLKYNLLWEPEVIDAVNLNIKENSEFIDIGAHIGLITLGVCNNEKINKIHSFECDNDNFNFLKYNTQNLHKINLYNFGLADKFKICTMNECKYNTGCNYINSTNDNGNIEELSYTWTNHSKESFSEKKNCYFNLIPLDSIMHQFNNISVIKIDVEGYEYYVLNGAKDIINKYSPTLIVEIGLDNIDRVLDLLNEMGYIISEVLSNENYVFIKN